ncbi:hypothetical protein BDF19DRAFT_435802 [Syncephalis fuscata]|nr:hypothetical protein BDF19DRAFT_435802 [Syncephalis fuscata]
MTTDTAPAVEAEVADTSVLSSDDEGANATFLSGDDDTDPIRLFSERLRSWKALSKQLIAYYEEIRQQELASAKGYARAAAVVRPPWRQLHAFRPGVLVDSGSGSGDELAATTEASATPVDAPAEENKEAQRERSARAISDQTIKELNRLRLECKRRGREVAKELANVKQKASKAGDNTKSQLVALEKSCEEQRELQISRKVGQEERSLPNDPWLIKLEVQRSLEKQFAKENRYQQALIAYQQSLTAFETSADIEAQVALLRTVHSTAERQDRDAESVYFYNKHAMHLPNVDTPLRSLTNSATAAAYPCLEHASATTLRIGRLERKGGLLNTWKECRAVLTAAGYLHCFPISSGIGTDQQTDLSQNPSPDVSIYLAQCTVGAHSVDGAADNSFEITEKAVDGGGLFRKSHHRYQIRASTRDDMLSWWQELSKHAQSTLVQASTAGSASGMASAPGTMADRRSTTDGDSGTVNKRSSMFARLGGSFGRAKGATTAAALDKSESPQSPTAPAVEATAVTPAADADSVAPVATTAEPVVAVESTAPAPAVAAPAAAETAPAPAATEASATEVAVATEVTAPAETPAPQEAAVSAT